MPRISAWLNFLSETGLTTTAASKRWKEMHWSEKAEYDTNRRTRSRSAQSKSKQRGRKKLKRSQEEDINRVDPHAWRAQQLFEQTRNDKETEEEEEEEKEENDDGDDSQIDSGTVVHHDPQSTTLMDSGTMVIMADKKSSEQHNGLTQIMADMVFDHEAYENRRRRRVSEDSYKEFQAWKQTHPSLELQLPAFETSKWMHITTDDLEVYVPRQIQIEDRSYIHMSVFPGSLSRSYYAGTSGLVASYQEVEGDRIIVLKIAPILNQAHVNWSERMEQDAFDILDYLSSSSQLHNACKERFIHMTASTVQEFKADNDLHVKQSFIVLERMDMTLEQLKEKEPKLFQNVYSIKHILSGLAQGMNCMHTAQPVPIAHGDLKPANVLCSPYTDRWIYDNIPERREREEADTTPPTQKKKVVYVKMADFDASFTSVWDLSHDPRNLGTLNFMSPERLMLYKHQRNASTPTIEDDVWAFGMILLAMCAEDTCIQLYEFISRQLKKSIVLNAPLQDRLTTYIVRQVGEARKVWSKTWTTPMSTYTRHNNNNNSKAYAELVLGCLQIEPSRRLTSQQIVQHPFFLS